MEKKKINCSETGCPLMFYRIADLKGHIKNEHGKTIKEITLMFDSYENFLAWKEHEQKKTGSYYSKQNTPKTNGKNTKYERFVCQWHGSEKKNVNSQKVGKRHNVKREGQCLARIIMTTNAKNEVSVRYTPEHSHISVTVQNDN